MTLSDCLVRSVRTNRFGGRIGQRGGGRGLGKKARVEGSSEDEQTVSQG